MWYELQYGQLCDFRIYDFILNIDEAEILQQSLAYGIPILIAYVCFFSTHCQIVILLYFCKIKQI